MGILFNPKNHHFGARRGELLIPLRFFRNEYSNLTLDMVAGSQDEKCGLKYDM
jgi:hypothetical protein